uniref:Uncharacterized protein n=1 Tax=Rheinheimera sp. BAL341 TaxID=1708203 RepID=A0A486XRU3_9GAMM
MDLAQSYASKARHDASRDKGLGDYYAGGGSSGGGSGSGGGTGSGGWLPPIGGGGGGGWTPPGGGILPPPGGGGGSCPATAAVVLAQVAAQVQEAGYRLSVAAVAAVVAGHPLVEAVACAQPVQQKKPLALCTFGRQKKVVMMKLQS